MRTNKYSLLVARRPKANSHRGNDVAAVALLAELAPLDPLIATSNRQNILCFTAFQRNGPRQSIPVPAP
jgi:hypothetical protein